MLESFGPYQILHLLGEGGMGQVFEALDRRNGSRVAVKLLRGGATATEREKELFAREARVGMELEHPGLVKVLAVEIALSPQPYIVMEYMPGPTLKGALEQGPLTPVNAIALALPILDTLAYVHGEGVIHRDVKTGNIMLDGRGLPRLMDFGLTTFSDETSLSRTGIVFGSPHYMSPEQGLGETIDHRSDLFSFAVVLYELVTGRLPFRGTHPLSVIYAIINEEPAPLRRNLPDLPAQLDWVLARAMSKRADDRYDSALAMRSDLAQVLELMLGRMSEGELALLAMPDRGTAAAEQFPMPLVGREGDLARLRRWLTSPGRARLLFLGGEAGVGKTRLVRETLGRVGLGAPAPLVGRAQPGREHFPYQPWLEAIRPALRERDLLDERSLVDWLNACEAGAGPRATILWPFLGGGETPAPENREQLFEALRFLLSCLSSREPLLLWLEDLHRVDRASLDLLAFFARCSPGEMPPILVSYRDDELDENNPLASLMRELRGEGLAESLTIARLGQEAVLRLVETLLPALNAPERAAERLQRESRGNPFILRELLEILRRRVDGREVLADDPEQWDLPIPARLQDLVSHRLAGLSADERELLEMAAVEGEAFSAEALAAVLQQRKLQVLRKLQGLERRTRLVQAREGRFLFDHGLVRRALYEGLGDELRCECHLAMGEYMESVSAERPESAAGIARHFLSAREIRRAVPYLFAAGRHARGIYAPHEAARHLERAREEVDIWWLEEPAGKARELRWQVLRELGLLEQGGARYQAAEKLFEGARSLLVPGLEDGHRADLDRLRGDVLVYEGRGEEAAREFKEALEICPRQDRRQQALILRSRAALESRENRWDEALASCEAAMLLTESYPREVNAVRHAMGLIHMSSGHLAEARRFFEAVVAQAQEVDEVYLRTAALANLGTVLWRLGEAEEAARNLEESLSLRRKLGLLIEYAQILTNLAIIRTKTGRLDDARMLLTESLELKQRTGDASGLASAENNFGNLENRAGRLRQALAHYRRAAELHFAGLNRARAAVALHNVGEVLLDLGEIDDSAEPLAQAEAIRRDLELDAALASTLRAQARRRAALGDEAGAEELFDLALSHALAEGGAEEAAKVELNRSRFLLDAGRAEEAEQTLARLREQGEHWPPAGLRFEFDLLEASLLFTGGEPDGAKKALLRLLDQHPADLESYRRLLILLELGRREWPGLPEDLAEAWREEAQRLRSEGEFDWLG